MRALHLWKFSGENSPMATLRCKSIKFPGASPNLRKDGMVSDTASWHATIA